MLNSKPAVEVRLKSPFWKHLGSRFKTLVVLPAFQTQFVLRTYGAPGGEDSWQIFGLLASKQKLAINTAYLARHDVDDLENQLKTLPGRICSGQFDDKTLCILSPRFLVRLLENNVTDVFCQTVDGVAVCWKAPSESEENRDSLWNALQEAGYSVSLIDRFAYHPHEVTMDLRRGFRLPDGELVLADGQESQIPLLLDQDRPLRRIRVDLTPLNFQNDSGRQFSVWVGHL